MFSRPKILFLVSLLFVALLNSIPTYLLNYLPFIYCTCIVYIPFVCIHTYVRIRTCMRASVIFNTSYIVTYLDNYVFQLEMIYIQYSYSAAQLQLHLYTQVAGWKITGELI